ncbi:MAG: hypothetical protein A2086_16220 [Spirochaetes bacterium GWD1_27_9]|nr:MAG: hypothetical protein A2Z98_13855 [Spirochaetes bacterium GWB1_27_13]OHD28701.1 MAG: hypothetical protein A2086_16220 [Spirochaetes bacterium GWD1_27_9]
MFIKTNIFEKIIGKKNKVKVPKIIEVSEHKIKRTMIDFNAIKIINRLNKFGFDAYIVGGAIRDYLLGKKPKDFDVATNATPKQIKKIFSNSRIIGKRFKLVHIIFKNAIIETATFRSNHIEQEKGIVLKDNVYGTIEEDAERRDFGINALYYNPDDETIIDFVNGYEDIKQRVVKLLKKPSISFLEDPVRMLRAVKYSVLGDCKIEKDVFKKIIKYSSELSKVSLLRLYEEINKILKSECATKIFLELHRTKLLKYFIPFLYEELDSGNCDDTIKYLNNADHHIKENKIEEVELYWGVMLYKKLTSQNFNQNDLTFYVNLKTFFTDILIHLRVPHKVCDHLAKSFYLFYKLQDEHTIKHFRRMKNHPFLHCGIFLLEVFEVNKVIIDFWKEHLVEKKTEIRPPRRPFKPQEKNIPPRKYITTKNYSD